jgi:hypothetical protein
MAATDEEELAPEMAKAIEALAFLKDEELWLAARNRLSDEARFRLGALNRKQQREELTPAEKEALEQLVHQYDQAVLSRAEAVRLLKDRGQDVSTLLGTEDEPSAAVAERPLAERAGHLRGQLDLGSGNFDPWRNSLKERNWRR